ncbi:sensor histidine kinase [Propionibacteriaceae bacterium G1746]|uniref:sensor histidine kinase n=1 Tax=Aestuariimicrobium sp. G57 TaxID=3418485 RepID=UPI003C188264
MSIIERLREWFGWDDDWERPRPPIGRADVVLATLALTMGWLNSEAVLSQLAHEQVTSATWLRVLLLVTGAALLVFRRRFPLPTMLLLGVHFFLAVTYAPEVGYTLVFQLFAFLGLYSGLAWGSNRRATILAAAALALGLATWLVWEFAVGRGLEGLGILPAESAGLFSPLTGAIVGSVLANGVYLFSSVLMGQVAWRQARTEHVLREQAETIQVQSERIAEDAVLTERLRLARELHDVVAHHISVMGVQASGARAVLSKDPDLAAQALDNVADASRSAVTQMRGLLGTLRSPRELDEAGRAPEPTLAEVADLARAATTTGFTVQYSLIEHAERGADDVPLPVGLTIYRTVQESITNARRHSSARHVRVVVRLDLLFAEVEVTDDGTPRPGSGGSGYGQLGIRERAESLGGEVELGPRPTGGYRVRVRLPLLRHGTGQVAGLAS